MHISFKLEGRCPQAAICASRVRRAARYSLDDAKSAVLGVAEYVVPGVVVTTDEPDGSRRMTVPDGCATMVEPVVVLGWFIVLAWSSALFAELLFVDMLLLAEATPADMAMPAATKAVQRSERDFDCIMVVPPVVSLLRVVAPPECR